MALIQDTNPVDVTLVVEMPEQKRRSFLEWFTKYFLEGQTLDHAPLADSDVQSAVRSIEAAARQSAEKEARRRKKRKFVAIFLPLVISQILWWSAAIKHDYLSLYSDYWQMPAAMIVGSTIAGMTSEAGGAVAFPVMTFALKTSPVDARDFSLLIQSFGMGLAMFTIVYNRIQVEWHGITYAVLGSLPGVVIGFHLVDPLLLPAQKKMIFVSVWSSFAIALWILNREKKRRVVERILGFCRWKGGVLLLTGFVGGIFTAFAGSGVDICLFSVCTLLFSLSEKIATPTTIVSMGTSSPSRSFNLLLVAALTSWFALYWRIVIVENISELVWNYIRCSIPVCTVMAHLVYFCEFVAMVGFLCTRPAWPLIAASCAILAVAFVFFQFVSRKGGELLAAESRKANDAVAPTLPLGDSGRELELQRVLIKPHVEEADGN
ncbi:hypothetical protein M3Y99_00808900 [Aphelenchoides fujianensis]|nr:hypothetical protein M3Y99_00808900 [Aphelenchoides fujianensis]